MAESLDVSPVCVVPPLAMHTAPFSFNTGETAVQKFDAAGDFPFHRRIGIG
jgi:hypothetical protein